MTLPTFIVIGAAKSGTTALYWYFAEHPQVFMSRVKETNYFAYGVSDTGDLLYGDPALHRFPVKTFQAYEQLFEGAGAAQAVGEVSPLYLESPQAADRIREPLPDVKIMCCIRHPVDRAYSDYQMYLRDRNLDLDAGRDFSPDSSWARPDSHWMRIGRYHEQLSRYYRAFPRNQIDVFLFEDLKRDPIGLMQRLYASLGVDPTFRPDLETPHNIGGMPASKLVEGFFRGRVIRMLRPWVPRQAANWGRRLRTRNMRQAPALPVEMRDRLTGYFREDISRTAELIGRDLTHWL
jgi:hypothetical protein